MGTMKLGTDTGSLFNYMMGNNVSQPVVGQGATILHWTDRSAYEVIEVSKDLKKCKIQRYDPERVDNLGMSDSQEYKYEKLTEEKHDLIFRNGAWRYNCTEIIFTKEFLSSCTKFATALNLTEEQRLEIYHGEPFPQKVVDGITKLKKVYPKVNIIFGVKREYYDYSF